MDDCTIIMHNDNLVRARSEIVVLLALDNKDHGLESIVHVYRNCIVSVIQLRG